MSLSEVQRECGTELQALADASERYKADHPSARIDYYVAEGYWLRVRVIDPSFKGLAKSKRHARVWKYLGSLPDELAKRVGMIVVITPAELDSGSNLEFEEARDSRSFARDP